MLIYCHKRVFQITISAQDNRLKLSSKLSLQSQSKVCSIAIKAASSQTPFQTVIALCDEHQFITD